MSSFASMFFLSTYHSLLLCGCRHWQTLFGFLFIAGTASAFPPAPYYTLYGVVRDQVGQTVTAEGAQVILLKGGVEVGRTPITSSQIDLNYELNMRLDHNRSGTAFYTDKAVAAGGLFSLVVSMNGAMVTVLTAELRLSRRTVTDEPVRPKSIPEPLLRLISMGA